MLQYEPCVCVYIYICTYMYVIIYIYIHRDPEITAIISLQDPLVEDAGPAKYLKYHSEA